MGILGFVSGLWLVLFLVIGGSCSVEASKLPTSGVRKSCWRAVREADKRTTILSSVLEAASDLLRREQIPIVLFDLDDTVCSARGRVLRILRDFVAQAGISNLYSVEIAKIRTLRTSQVEYDLEKTLRKFGVGDSKFISLAEIYWSEHFFTDEYTSKDTEVAGAGKFLRRLHATGATIIYITGRDEPGMLLGTIDSLRNLNFPYGDRALLMMKPSHGMSDLVFKNGKYPYIRSMGTVIAGFENEPANVNSFKENFPDGTMVLIGNAHSDKPVTLHPDIIRLGDFRTPGLAENFNDL